MREKLNSNPVAQIAVIAVLLVATGFLVMSSMGGGGGGASEESEASATSSTTAATGVVGEGAAAAPSGSTAALAMVSQASAGAARPLPHPVIAAWNANKAVVLLFVHDGGIDDKLVSAATARLDALPDVATFVVPAGQIFRYAAITEGVGVDRVPALVVVRPKSLRQTVPTASVSYGFQSGESVVQAVVDAGYRGPTVDYHP